VKLLLGGRMPYNRGESEYGENSENICEKLTDLSEKAHEFCNEHFDGDKREACHFGIGKYWDILIEECES